MHFKYVCCVCENKTEKNSCICEKCYTNVKEHSKSRKCAICNRNILENSVEIVCDYCKKLSPKFDAAIAVTNYGGEFKKALINFKYHGHYYKVKGFSQLMIAEFNKLYLTVDIVVPVPSSRFCYFDRKYSAQTELSYFVGKGLNCKVYDNILIKSGGKPQQSLISLKERYENVKNMFRIGKRKKKIIEGKKILLIDDIITTGATSSECAKILKENGAESVCVLALLYGGG